MRNEVRRKLLIEYAVALVAERESWERLRDPELTEAQRCRLFGEWKQTAAGLKQLVRRLRDAEPAPVVTFDEVPHAAESLPGASVAATDSEDTWPAAASAAAPRVPRPFHVPWLAASVRHVARWCARFDTAMARAGSA